MDEIDEAMRQINARVSFGRELRLKVLGADEQTRQMQATNMLDLKEFPGYVTGWREMDAQLVADGRDETLPIPVLNCEACGRPYPERSEQIHYQPGHCYICGRPPVAPAETETPA